jgi:hypothetical protein
VLRSVGTMGYLQASCNPVTTRTQKLRNLHC